MAQTRLDAFGNQPENVEKAYKLIEKIHQEIHKNSFNSSPTNLDTAHEYAVEVIEDPEKEEELELAEYLVRTEVIK